MPHPDTARKIARAIVDASPWGNQWSHQGLGRIGGTMIARLKKMGLVSIGFGLFNMRYWPPPHWMPLPAPPTQQESGR